MHRQGTTGGSDHQLALVNVGWRACWNKRASDSPLWECLVKPPVFGPMVSAHRIEASIWSVAQRSLRKVFPLTPRDMDVSWRLRNPEAGRLADDQI